MTPAPAPPMIAVPAAIAPLLLVGSPATGWQDAVADLAATCGRALERPAAGEWSGAGGEPAAVVVLEGRGAAVDRERRAQVQRIARRRPVVWHDPGPDPHPVAGATLVVLGLASLAGAEGGRLPRTATAIGRAAARLAQRQAVHMVAIVLDDGDAIVARCDGTAARVVGRRRGRSTVPDAATVAARAAAELADGALPEEAVRLALATVGREGGSPGRTPRVERGTDGSLAVVPGAVQTLRSAR
ncbi:hypothetical protein GCM10022215_12670 [Nocardioides fonticola]|uniref:Uncharacterized protein n=2 Tax=Nocardioides fonticola TaxID=450363 RepID=A0ABP7XGF4_9ACTN